MSTLLTVDWDTFIPENTIWDMGHQESLMFLNMMWQMRMSLFKEMKTDGEEVDFWEKIRQVVDLSLVDAVTVSDSHAYVWSEAAFADTIILVDAHHDTWAESDPEDNIYCHNWARKWLIQDTSRHLFWIQPDWADGSFSVSDDLSHRVTRCPFSEFDRFYEGAADSFDIDGIHICRSGCWTPPWLDSNFIEFVERVGLEVISLQDGAWDPMVERWGEKEFDVAWDVHRRTELAMKGMSHESQVSSSRD